MAAVLVAGRMTPEEYLAWDARQDTKNEYVAGEVVPMVGARRDHNLVAGNVYRCLTDALEGTACLTFIGDIKLHVPSIPAYFYPDVMVTCDQRDAQAQLAMQSPVVVIEVLSDSTASYDRGRKFAAYRTIESLREYVLIDIDQRRVNGFRRTGADAWAVIEFAAQEPVRLESIDVTIDRADLFRRVS